MVVTPVPADAKILAKVDEIRLFNGCINHSTCAMLSLIYPG
jgi:hypothetical protein